MREGDREDGGGGGRITVPGGKGNRECEWLWKLGIPFRCQSGVKNRLQLQLHGLNSATKGTEQEAGTLRAPESRAALLSSSL